MNLEFKICSKCKLEKDISNYSKNNTRKDGLHSSCKECKRKDQKEWYEKHAKEHISRVKKNKDKIKKYLQEFKANKPCFDCGIIYPPYVMDFDHINSDKKFDISDISKCGSIKALKKEINKCELVCSNCHRIRTFNRACGATVSATDS